MLQVGFGLARSVLLAFVFAAPAAYAGYHVVFGLTLFGIPSDAWRHVFAAVGAIVVGFTAVARLTRSRWVDFATRIGRRAMRGSERPRLTAN
jgi:hypothetical protein